MKVCVIEDDASMRRALQRLFKAANHEVVAFDSAEALLKFGQVDTFGCVVLDLNLPGMSGIQLLELLKPFGPSLPIVVITSHESPGLQQDVLNRGAFAYLKKPFEGEDLLATINRIQAEP
jgi:FixJ family two-component response regulator